MRAAILCPGPSLSSRPPGDWAHADVTIGVNGAAQLGVHWMAAFDVPMVQAHACHASVGVFSHAAKWDGLKSLPVLWAKRLILTDTVLMRLPREIQRAGGSFSKCGALVLAWCLGADVIELHGDDMSGETYFDGSPCAATSWRQGLS